MQTAPAGLSCFDAAELAMCAALVDDRPALLRRLQRRHKIARLSDRQKIANALCREAKAGTLPSPPSSSLPLDVPSVKAAAGAALIELQRRARDDGDALLRSAGLSDAEMANFLGSEDLSGDSLLAALSPATVYSVLEATDAVPPAHARLLRDALELGGPRIAFWSQSMTERGTEVALFDYADYTESLLGGTSHVLYDATNPANSAAVIRRFEARFGERCVGIDHQIGLDPFLESCGSSSGGGGSSSGGCGSSSGCSGGGGSGCSGGGSTGGGGTRASGSILRHFGITHVYSLKAGSKASAGPDVARLHAAGITTLVHAVFDGREEHGDAYARISPCVPGRCAVVPHIVRPPLLPPPPIERHVERVPEAAAVPAARPSVPLSGGGSLRACLGIPDDATVFGRHGGLHTFDIEFARRALVHVARAAAGRVYFLLLNTAPIAGAEGLANVIHLPGPIVSPEAKAAFIRACDAMLHARQRGETFGLAVAEFAAHNKPVLTSRAHTDGGLARYHLDVLGARAMLYDDFDSLVDLLVGFDRGAAAERGRGGYYAAPYLPFEPRRVMLAFRRAFLEEPSTAPKAKTLGAREELTPFELAKRLKI